MKGKQQMRQEDKIDFVLVGDPHTFTDEDAELDQLAQIATELGSHAASQAIEAMIRVLNTAPGRAYPAAVAVAHAEIEWKLQAAADQMDKISPGFVGVVAALKRELEAKLGSRFRRVAATLRESIFGQK